MEIQEGHFLDACGVDGLCMHPTLSQSVDPSTFFVGDIDATEAQRPNLRACQSSNDLLVTEMDSAHLLPPYEALLGTSAPACLLTTSWNAFPSIPEHAELHMQSSGLPFGTRNTLSEDNSPSMSSTSSGQNRSHGGNGIGLGGGVPRVASMPNLPLSASAMTSTDLRRRAAVNRAGMPRSRSETDLTDMGKYIVPHSEFLTPPHLRKGKGGRQPAVDPRLDPRIDPKKARRILANRMSAAKSKMKQKSAVDGLRQRMEMLRLQRETLSSEVSALSEACAVKEAERETLQRQIRAVEESLRGSLSNGLSIAKGALENLTPARMGLVG